MDRRRRGMRMLIGLWILAGLVTLGINGYVWVALFDQPLAGYSDAVRHLGQRIRTYQMLMTTKSEKMFMGIESLSQRFASQAPAAAAPMPKQSAPLTTAKKKPRVSSPISLPILSGIMTRRSADGRVVRMAVLDGGLFSEGAKVGNLVVNKISDDGVLLIRGKKNWFIKAPEIIYSVTTR